MSARHPIISVTGSSGAGTTSVRNTFEQIFRREDVSAVYIEGDGFHAHDRDTMRAMMAREPTLSHFAPRATLLPELEAPGSGRPVLLPQAERPTTAAAARPPERDRNRRRGIAMAGL